MSVQHLEMLWRTDAYRRIERLFDLNVYKLATFFFWKLGENVKMVYLFSAICSPYVAALVCGLFGVL